MDGWVPSGHRTGVIVKGIQLPPLRTFSECSVSEVEGPCGFFQLGVRAQSLWMGFRGPRAFQK